MYQSQTRGDCFADIFPSGKAGVCLVFFDCIFLVPEVSNGKYIDPFEKNCYYFEKIQ